MSYGASHITFQPNVDRSFNRGFTEYFLHGRTPKPIHSFATPKAVGVVVGKVGRTDRRSFCFEASRTLAAPLTAGDGLCYVDEEGTLQGFRVNKVEGRNVFPATMPRLRVGTVLHRSLDFAFDKALAKATAKRTLAAHITLRELVEGYALDMADESGCHVTMQLDYPHEDARSSQREAITRQLSKLGDTPFVAQSVTIDVKGERFIPASVLTEWRRKVCERLLADHQTCYERDRTGQIKHEALQKLLPKELAFNANVANHLAQAFYAEHGVGEIAPAFELKEPQGEVPVMTCKHCIRHALGICLKKVKNSPRSLALRLPDGRTFPLLFDCRNCEMKVLKR